MAEMFLPVSGITMHDLADTFGAARSGGRSHKGIDIFAPEGRGVVAVRGGTVVKAGNGGKLGGLRVWVKDDQGYFHYYAHLSAIDVKDGQKVKGGQRLGAVGKTGNARTTPAHLHYSVNQGGGTSESAALNPYEFLTGASVSSAASSSGGQVQAAGVDGVTPVEPVEQSFEEGRRTSSDTMASIMSFISQAASQRGGRVLNTKALFGDVFADKEADEPAGEDAYAPVGAKDAPGIATLGRR